MEGGCLCGAVRYGIAAPPHLIYACHCTECQTQTGSAFGLGAVVEDAAFRFTRGAPKTFARTGDSGRRSTYSLCPDCGTRLASGRIEPPGAAPLRILRAGTLDDAARLTPGVHVWTRSAQPWLRIPGGARRFETRPPVPVWLLED